MLYLDLLEVDSNPQLIKETGGHLNLRVTVFRKRITRYCRQLSSYECTSTATSVVSVYRYKTHNNQKDEVAVM